MRNNLLYKLFSTFSHPFSLSELERKYERGSKKLPLAGYIYEGMVSPSADASV
jgi:hypothetical protein